MIPWILPLGVTALYLLFRESRHDAHGRHRDDDEPEHLPERHRGQAPSQLRQDPPAAPLQPGAVAVMLSPWHLRPRQTESRTGSRAYAAGTRVELLQRGTLTRHTATMHQVRVMSDGNTGWAYVLPSELAAGEASRQTSRTPPPPAPPPPAPPPPPLQPGVQIASHAEPASGQWGAPGTGGDPNRPRPPTPTPAAAPAPAAASSLPPTTREIVSATERSVAILGQDAATSGRPSENAVRAAQFNTSYPVADGQWAMGFRRYLARNLGPEAERVYPSRDARHRAARELAAYSLLATNPQAQTPIVADRQRALGVDPSGRIDARTGLAMLRELRG